MTRGKIFRGKTKKRSGAKPATNTVFAQKKVPFQPKTIVESDDDESGGGQGKRLLGFYKKEKLASLIGKKFKMKDFLPFLNREKMTDEITKSPVTKDVKENAELHEQAKLAEEAEKRVAERHEGNEQGTQEINESSTRAWGREAALTNTEINVAAQAYGRSLEGVFANPVNPIDNAVIGGRFKTGTMYGSAAQNAITYGVTNPFGFGTQETRERQTNAAINAKAALTRQTKAAVSHANTAALRQKNTTFAKGEGIKKNSFSQTSTEAPSLSTKGRR